MTRLRRSAGFESIPGRAVLGTGQRAGRHLELVVGNRGGRGAVRLQRGLEHDPPRKGPGEPQECGLRCSGPLSLLK